MWFGCEQPFLWGSVACENGSGGDKKRYDSHEKKTCLKRLIHPNNEKLQVVVTMETLKHRGVKSSGSTPCKLILFMSYLFKSEFLLIFIPSWKIIFLSLQ